MARRRGKAARKGKRASTQEIAIPIRSRVTLPKRRRAVPSTPAFAAALESAAKHSLAAQMRSSARRSRAAKRAWERRKHKAKHGPPKAFSVRDVARAFEDAQMGVDFARRHLIHPSEWADDLSDDFDVDVHSLYEAYYDTDPATQGRLTA